MPHWFAILLSMAVAVAAAPATATLPDTGMSTWDSTLGVSPKNETVPATHRYEFTGTLRDFNGVPIPGYPAAQLVLDFETCSNPSTRPSNHIPADADTDANGFVRWSVNLDFGGGDPCGVRVLVSNIVFKQLLPHGGRPDSSLDGGVRSPDQNGDGVIGLVDLGIFQAEFVNTGTRLDYRGDLAQVMGIYDGLTTIADLAAFQVHFVAP